MKKFLAFATFLMLGSVQLFHGQSSHSQFSMPSENQKAAMQATRNGRAALPQGNFAAANTGNTPSGRAHANGGTPTNPPLNAVSFVGASATPAGGQTHWVAVSADFNNDGKLDVAAPVQTGTSSYGVAIALSNGDGTFTAKPVIANPNGVGGDQILVGDFNNNGNQDLIVVHATTPSTFEVWPGNGDGTFNVGAHTILSISGKNVIGGVVTDVNADGKLDLIFVDNHSPANVLTLLGNGLGGFSPQSPSSVTVTSGVLSNVVFADFNNDGILDFAASDGGSGGQNVIFVGGVSGSHFIYTAGTPLTNPDAHYAVCNNAAGDLTGDGIPELITANCNTLVSGNSGPGNLSIFVNNGDGTFKPGVYYSAGSDGSDSTNPDIGPVAVTIADVNGDGKNDIVSSNGSGGDITVLMGNGDGTVTVPTVGYDTGGLPHTSAIVADFNGDGFVDLLVPDYASNFAYLQGYGDGSFRAAKDYYSPVPGGFVAFGNTIATGDFNGDGVPDFVVGNVGFNPTTPSGIGITVFLSNPDGSMKPGFNLGTGGAYEGVATGDFTGNGKMSIATVNQSNNGVQLYLGDGAGDFSAGSFYPTGGTFSNQIASADFNNDGFPDLVTLNTPSSGTPNISILLNDASGHGTFLSAVTYNTSTGGIAMAVGDVNNDGIPDVVVSQSNSGVDVFLGNANGTFQAVRTSALGLSGLGNVVLGDLNGDGNLDLAVVVNNGSGEGIAVAKGNGDGTFGTAVLYATTLQNTTLSEPAPVDVKIADVNGNGKLDLVYSNTGYDTIGVLYNTGSNPFAAGMFYDPVEYPAGGDVQGLAVVDVNGDGALDVVAADGNYAGVTVLLNGNGSLTTVVSGLSTAPVTKPVTFTANVAANVKGISAVPTGTATFYDGSTSLGSVTLASGVASYTASALSVGTHNITVKYSGDSNFMASTSAVVSQLITLAPDSNVLTSSLNPAAVGQSITIQATITSTASGVTAVPSGNVTYFDGSTSLGSLPLTSSLVISSLSAGTHSITAQYAGDANFAASTATALSQVIVAPDFSLSVNQSSMSVNPGTSATYTFTVTPSNGYSGTIGLSCPSSLPATVGCSFSPTSLSPSGGTYPTTTLTLSTVGTSAALAEPARPNSRPATPILLASLSGFGVFGIVLAGAGRKRSLRRMLTLGMLSLAIMFLLVGCGGSSSSGTHTGSTGTPAGSYMVTVTAAGSGSGAPSHTMSVTLVVQ